MLTARGSCERMGVSFADDFALAEGFRGEALGHRLKESGLPAGWKSSPLKV